MEGAVNRLFAGEKRLGTHAALGMAQCRINAITVGPAKGLLWSIVACLQVAFCATIAWFRCGGGSRRSLESV